MSLFFMCLQCNEQPLVQYCDKIRETFLIKLGNKLGPKLYFTSLFDMENTERIDMMEI